MSVGTELLQNNTFGHNSKRVDYQMQTEAHAMCATHQGVVVGD
jgi:hypothetical protein